MSNNVILMDNRQLIPRWHTSRKAMQLQFPTLSVSPKQASDYHNDKFLEKAKRHWQEDPNFVNAIELHTSLITRGIYSDVDGDAALRFLLSIEEQIPKGAKDLIAPQIKHIDKSKNYYTYLPQEVSKIITRLRTIVARFPNDYMTWCDLGFYYTVLGMTKKAERCMAISWHLCNGHPYIARSYARFCVHNDEPEKALWLLKKSGGLNKDPLITSASIAIGYAFDLGGIDISKARRLLDGYTGIKAFSSELAASIGTLEFNNGKKKKAKDYFKAALIEPSENTLSQYKWLCHKTGFSVNGDSNDNALTLEGNVHQLYVQGDFEECRARLLELFSFQPISDGPIADAGYMSLVGLNDPDFVIQLSENRVPKTHMSFGELNNLTVAKLMKNDLESAEVCMRLLAKKIDPEKPDSRGIYLATSGFIMFKLGNVDSGKALYQKAIKFFESKKAYRAVALAEHYYSNSVKEIDPPLFESLRKKVEKKAKDLGMKELSTDTNNSLNN
jgi:tetratricopeptide (TPR) repeat protein